MELSKSCFKGFANAQTSIGLIVLLLGGAACNKKGSAPLTLEARGRNAYVAHCISCHNADPSKPGSIGPEVKGASLELLRERMLNASYPPGYKPKRETRVMPKQPHLAGEIEALAEFLK